MFKRGFLVAMVLGLAMSAEATSPKAKSRKAAEQDRKDAYVAVAGKIAEGYDTEARIVESAVDLFGLDRPADRKALEAEVSRQLKARQSLEATWTTPTDVERLEAACQEGGTSFYTSGIDPGFGNAGLAIHLLALCKEVRTVRMMEIVNYATWDNPFTMFEIMGFGKPDPSHSLLLAPGSTTLAWGPVLGLVAVGTRHAAATGGQDVQLEAVPGEHRLPVAQRRHGRGPLGAMRQEPVVPPFGPRPVHRMLRQPLL